MGRWNHFIGLTDECERLVNRPFISKYAYDKIVGMFDEEFLLYIYKDKETGESWQEYIQFEEWNGGPWYFTALKNTNTEEVKGWKRAERKGLYVDREKGEFWV